MPCSTFLQLFCPLTDLWFHQFTRLFGSLGALVGKSANIYLEDIQEALSSPFENCSLKKMTFFNCILGLDLSLLVFCMSIFNKQVESNKKVRFSPFPPVMYTLEAFMSSKRSVILSPLGVTPSQYHTEFTRLIVYLGVLVIRSARFDLEEISKALSLHSEKTMKYSNCMLVLDSSSLVVWMSSFNKEKVEF